MADDQVLEDVEVHFTHGDPLFMEDVMARRGTYESGYIYECRERAGATETVCIPEVGKVNYWKVIKRTVTAE